MAKFKLRLPMLGVLLWLGATLAATAGHDVAARPVKRVLVVYENESTLPVMMELASGLRKGLDARLPTRFELYSEYLDSARFPSQDHLRRLADDLSVKYADVHLDVAMTVGPSALQFMLDNRSRIAPGVPLIFGGVSEEGRIKVKTLPSDVKGVISHFDLRKTIDLARRLQPEAKKATIVTGSAEFDRGWEKTAREALGSYRSDLDVEYLSGLTLEGFKEKAKRLPPDVILLILTVFQDAEGRKFVPREAAAEIAEASGAPSYTVYSPYIGVGSLGGYVETFEAMAQDMARLADQYLVGANPTAQFIVSEGAPVVDWRQMRRWGISESRLPAGSEVRFRPPTLWEEHRGVVLATIAAFALLLSAFVLLAGYLLQSRRRLRAEAALVETEDRMAFATSATNSGFWRINGKDATISATDACLEMFGLSNDGSCKIDDLAKVVHPEDRQLFTRTVWSAVRDNAPIDFRFRVAAPGGSVRWIAAKGFGSAQNGERSLVVNGIFSDVTLLKELENDRDRQREEVTHLMRHSVVNELSGSIAHELNQPLAAIMSNAEAALNQLDQKKADLGMVRDSLADIVEEDARAAEVISRVRRLIRKDAGKREMIDVEKLFDSTHALLRSELVGRRISLEIACDPDIPPILGDFVQLQQVLINLLMNAMEAMTHAASLTPTITLGAAQNDGRVQITVSDDGPGIPADIQNSLFEPLATTKSQGLGLGLSICATIIKTHGGSIVLKNKPAGGAIAVVSVPQGAPAEAAQ